VVDFFFLRISLLLYIFLVNFFPFLGVFKCFTFPGVCLSAGKSEEMRNKKELTTFCLKLSEFSGKLSSCR
jgi:hypothetical protein